MHSEAEAGKADDRNLERLDDSQQPDVFILIDDLSGNTRYKQGNDKDAEHLQERHVYVYGRRDEEAGVENSRHLHNEERAKTPIPEQGEDAHSRRPPLTGLRTRSRNWINRHDTLPRVNCSKRWNSHWLI
ncbi:MAG: hypothetical protein KBA32_14810 [Propionivibrio sp.]|uniref:hypothetical protein n=1 Tax=Propionivibrio sp. TaxID=2212460 RepID=UPI001B6ED805|nr:hypothetical protein [Propionivibrio sp.]MBP7204459.1 hypothetical protein [Propionivibrio sp.]